MRREEFIAAVEAEYSVQAAGVAERVIIDAALSTLDEIERLKTALAAGDVLVVSERGNVRANPAFDQLLRHRTALARLTGMLFANETPKTRAARRAAEARWRKA